MARFRDPVLIQMTDRTIAQSHGTTFRFEKETIRIAPGIALLKKHFNKYNPDASRLSTVSPILPNVNNDSNDLPISL